MFCLLPVRSVFLVVHVSGPPSSISYQDILTPVNSPVNLLSVLVQSFRTLTARPLGPAWDGHDRVVPDTDDLLRPPEGCGGHGPIVPKSCQVQHRVEGEDPLSPCLRNPGSDDLLPTSSKTSGRSPVPKWSRGRRPPVGPPPTRPRLPSSVSSRPETPVRSHPGRNTSPPGAVLKAPGVDTGDMECPRQSGPRVRVD